MDKVVTFTKTDLIAALSQETGMTKIKSKEVVDKLFNILVTHLQSGETVKIHEFGIFETCQYKPCVTELRMGSKKGETFEIPARKHVKFRSSEKLNEKINH